MSDNTGSTQMIVMVKEPEFITLAEYSIVMILLKPKLQ
jgi:hypothetical protein